VRHAVGARRGSSAAIPLPLICRRPYDRRAVVDGPAPRLEHPYDQEPMEVEWIAGGTAG
jgi:hypothetical protein